MAIKGEPGKDPKGWVKRDLLTLLENAGYKDRNQQAVVLREAAQLAEALAPLKPFKPKEKRQS